MPSTPIPVFLDTSAIRKAGFRHPDFQKLLEHSKSNTVRLFVSYIAWEELRTQLLETACTEVIQVRQNFEALRRGQPESFILQGLRSPAPRVRATAARPPPASKRAKRKA
jgi:predicted nucleic acid-binding protein